MKAILTTRCGCSREMEVSNPPPPYIDIPLNVRKMNKVLITFVLYPHTTDKLLQTRRFVMSENFELYVQYVEE